MTEQQSTCESADLDEFLEAVGSESKAERAARISSSGPLTLMPAQLLSLIPPLSSDGPDTIP